MLTPLPLSAEPPTPTSSRQRRTGSGGGIKGSKGKGGDFPVRVLSPYPMSPLATPALHSSKLIHQQLTALTQVATTPFRKHHLVFHPF